MIRVLFLLLATCVYVAPAMAAERVISIGGSVTEIVYMLEQEERLVGRDTTSSFPPEAESLPDVGYKRALSPEGVLSLDPDLVLAEEGSGPHETIAVLENARVRFVTVPTGYGAEAIRAKIEVVSDALGVPDRGRQLADRIESELEAAVAAASTDRPARVLFILSMQGGRIMAGGRDTSADGIIRLAGAENAMTGFTGYKPLTDEAVIATAPDVILMMERAMAGDDAGGNHGIDNDALFNHPGLAATPAAERQAVVRIDGLLLLGFGPRTPEAVRALTSALADFDEAG
ncbi:ABC transporter substrate-binding protein [Wenzhouxiangella sp. XN24]|uniref:heme/hemin ABC transporter substrate-binding protein n=1 Tax=Wenzhouxiangella sp. XN24 TaxID=2713569 RepID=UPI0013ED10FE|nr:ABC transporter substrate-binding protein [Wenzhouxiangella sp. XN24]NGX16362.1 ABC transporter substrate-binding protein [Wenzhouxiangella sp. XN24]